MSNRPSAHECRVALEPFDVAHVIEAVHEDGYCHIEQVLSPELVKQTLDRVQSAYEEADRRASKENVPALAKNDLFIWNLQNKDRFYLDVLFGSPELQQVLRREV